MFNLQVILITGASSGIGEQITYQLAGLGAKLVIVARTKPKLERVKENALKRGASHVEIIIYDFSNVSDSKSVIKEAVRRVGTIDHAILNQGAMPWGMFLKTPKHQDPDFINTIFSVNVFSNIQMVLELIPILEGNSGHVFITSSTMGEVPNFQAAVYGASKAALNGFFYSLQQELLAKKSNVTLTVGNIGLIMTKELSAILGDEPIPDFAKGDLGTCARQIIDTVVSRQRTLNYPYVATILARNLFNFFPLFPEMIVSSQDSYEQEHASHQQREEMKLKMDYQRGY